MNKRDIKEVYSIIEDINNGATAEQIEELCSYIKGEENIDLLYVYQYNILKALKGYAQYIYDEKIVELIKEIK